jgi:flagellar hook-associated protein 3 FlgL
MRTTFNAMYREAGAGIETAAARLSYFQRQVSTGKRLEKPSDDPSGTATAIGEHAELASVERYSKSAISVGSKLSVIDTVLSDIVEKLSAASVAVVGARGTSQTPAQREASAQQLEGLKATLFDNFNTSFQGSYVFGGAGSAAPPYAKDGAGVVQPYAGTAGEVFVDIDKNRSVKVAMNGDVMVTSGGEDLFGVMDEMIAAARTGDSTALGAGLPKLAAAMLRVTTTQSRVGADLNMIDDQRLRLGQMKIAAGTRLDKVESANMAEAITGMNQAQSAYEAALGAAGAVTRASLMDYLR